MTPLAGLGLRPFSVADAADDPGQGWSALQHLVLARVLVASLALPVGILLRPGVADHPQPLLWGAVAGYVGGRLDNVMMRMVDILYALPSIVFVIVKRRL